MGMEGARQRRAMGIGLPDAGAFRAAQDDHRRSLGGAELGARRVELLPRDCVRVFAVADVNGPR